MSFLALGLAVATTLSLGAASGQSASTGARVTGRVVDASSGAPLADARVTLVPAERRSVFVGVGLPPQVVTDQDGGYVFDGVAGGRYRLVAQKTGYADLSGPAGASGVHVDVRGGQRVIGPDIRLVRGGAISGRVLNSRGEPLPDVTVTAFHPVTVGGRPQARGIPSGQASQTNDLGEFRISGLRPGEYYVAAHPSPQPRFVRRSPANNTTLVATYFPGVRETAAAQTLVVNGSETVAGLEFMMLTGAAFAITGIVVDEQDRPVAGAMISMLSSGPREPLFFAGAASASTQSDGTFRLDSVTSGTYRLRAILPVVVSDARGGGGSIVTWGATSGVMRGSVAGPAGASETVEVTVADADVSGVQLVVRRR